MTRIYDMETKESVLEESFRGCGFTISKDDILNINGVKYKVCEIEYKLEIEESHISLGRRKIYVEECE